MLVNVNDLQTIKNFAISQGVTAKTIYDRIKLGYYKKQLVDGVAFINLADPKNDHAVMIELWYQFFKKKYGRNPHFRGADAKAIKTMKEYFQANFEQTPSEVFYQILLNWDRLPKFIREKYSLTILLSGINEVISVLETAHKNAIQGENLSDKFDNV